MQGIVIIKEAVRFGMVGIANVAAYYGAYLALYAAIPYFAAHVIGYAVAILVSFFLNCYFTYRTRPTVRKFVFYPLTQLTSFVVTSVGVTLLVEGLGVDERLAPIVAACVAIPIAFLLSRRILTGRTLGVDSVEEPSVLQKGG